MINVNNNASSVRWQAPWLDSSHCTND